MREGNKQKVVLDGIENAGDAQLQRVPPLHEYFSVQELGGGARLELVQVKHHADAGHKLQHFRQEHGSGGNVDLALKVGPGVAHAQHQQSVLGHQNEQAEVPNEPQPHGLPRVIRMLVGVF